MQIKNNNPGNLIASRISWTGEIPSQTRFANFSSLAYGCRANLMNIHHHFRKGHHTIRSLINAWAPEVLVIKTVQYVRYVAGRLKISADAPLPWNKQFAVRLLCAMTRIEHGTEINPDIVEQGWDLMPANQKMSPSRKLN